MELITDFILVAGLLLTLGFLFLLFRVSNKLLPSKILIVFFVFIFFVNLHAYASLHQLQLLFLISFPFDFSVIWFLGPLLLLYIRSLVKEHTNLVRQHLIHFLPFVLINLLVGIPLWWFLIKDQSPPFEYLQWLDQQQGLITLIRNLYFIVYIVFSLQLFHTYFKVIKDHFAHLSIEDFSWIKHFLWGCLIFISVDLLLRLYEYIFSSIPFDLGFLTMYAIVVFTAYIGFSGLQQSSVLLPAFLFDKKTKQNPSILKEVEIKDLAKRLSKIMEDKEPYLDDNLSLGLLAKEMEISSKKLSHLLNHHLKTTFFDYINHYRVEAFKQKIKAGEAQRFTLLALAFSCGFRSKASFNRIFKKETGMSPSAYRKAHE